MGNNDKLDVPSKLHETILTNYPFPIAANYKTLFEKEELREKLLALFGTYEYTIRYISLLLLSLYYAEGKYNAELENFIEDLDNSNLDHWFSFLNQFMALDVVENSFALDVKNWYREVEQEQKIYSQEVVDYRYVNKEFGYLSAVLEVQKSIAPSLSVMIEEELDRYLSFCQEALNCILEELSFLKKYSLIWVETRIADKTYQVKQLHGADRNFLQNSLDAPNSLSLQQVYLHFKDSNICHPLHPFVIYQDCYYCIREELLDIREVFLLQSHTSKRLCYAGVIHRVGLREHTQDYSEIIEEYKASAPQKPLSIKEIWEKSFHITEEVLKQLKAIDLIHQYYPRKDAEYSLESFISGENHFPLFCVIGAKGVGKTVLLAEIAKSWSSRGEVVFFLRVLGHQGMNLEKYFAQVLGGENLLATMLGNSPDSKWIIILDGIENSKNPKQFINEITKFASQYKNHLKIIVSMQSVFYQLFSKQIQKNLFMKVDGKCPLVESSLPYLLLRDFSLALGRDVYSVIVRNRVGPVSSYESFPRTIKGMLSNPAVARIFLWALKNREIPRHMGLRDVMEGFVMNQINSTRQRRELVEKYTEILLQQNCTQLTLDKIVETDDDQIIQEALTFSMPCTLGDLEKEGIVERVVFQDESEKNILLRFPITIVQEYFLYRSIALAGKHGDEYLPTYLEEIHQGNYSLMGAVYFAFIRLADKQYFDRLGKVINKVEVNNPFVRNVLYNVLVFKEKSTGGIGRGGSFDEMIDTLLNQPTMNSILALADFAVTLYGEGKYAAAGPLFEKLSGHFSDPVDRYDSLTLTLLSARAYQHTNNKRHAHKLYKKCYKMLKKIEGTEREAEIYSFLGRANRELEDFEKAKYFFDRCRALKEKFVGQILETYLFEDLGRLAEQNGLHKEALKYYQRQQEAAENLDREDKIGDALGNIARIRHLNGDKEEALSLLEEACQLFTETGDSRSVAACQKEMADILTELNRLPKAIHNLIDALAIFESLEEQVKLADVYMKLGEIYEGMEKREECKIYFDKAMHVLREIGDENGLARCFVKFALLDYKQKNYKEALEKYTKALDIYKRSNHYQGLGDIYNHLGTLYNSQGDVNKAQQYYMESLKIRQQLKDKKGVAETINNFVVVLAHTKKFPQALEKLKECRGIYIDLKDQKGIATTKGTEALVYKLQGDSAQALKAYQECAEMLEKITEERLLGTIYNNIGLLYKEKGDFYNALAYFEKGAKVQESIADIAGLAASYNNIGLIYDAKNEYEKALKYYSKDLELTQKLGDKRGIATSYNNIAILHYNHRNYARALWYLEKSVPLYEELDDKQMARKVKERIQYVREKL